MSRFKLNCMYIILVEEIVDETVGFFQSLVAFAKLKRQILLCQPEAKSPKDFTDSSLFWVNQEFAVM